MKNLHPLTGTVLTPRPTPSKVRRVPFSGFVLASVIGSAADR